MALSASCARPFVRSPARLPNKLSTDQPTIQPIDDVVFANQIRKLKYILYCNKKSSKTFPYVSKIYDAFASLFRTNKKTLTTIYIRPGPIDWPKSLKNTYLKKISPETETTGPFLYANYVCRMLSNQTPARPTVQPIARLFDS